MELELRQGFDTKSGTYQVNIWVLDTVTSFCMHVDRYQTCLVVEHETCNKEVVGSVLTLVTTQD